MAVSSRSVFRTMDEALKLDNDNKNEAAYVQYLNCIISASSCMLQISTHPAPPVPNVYESKKLVKVITMCAERLESLLEHQDKENVSSSKYPSDLPPQYSEVFGDCTVGANSAENYNFERASYPKSSSGDGNFHTLHSVSQPFSPCEQIKPVSPDYDDPVHDMCTDDSISSSLSTNYSDESSIATPQSNSSTESAKCVFTRDNPSSPMEEAMKRNKSLVQRYQTRLSHVKQPGDRELLMLELQRRLVDNLKSAELEQKKMRESQRKRQKEMIQRVRKRLKDIDHDDESGLRDDRIRDLCKKCLSYEQDQEHSWPNDLRDYLGKNITASLIVYVVQETLSVQNYPLSKWLTNRQKVIAETLKGHIRPHSSFLRQVSHPNIVDVGSRSPVNDETEDNEVDASPPNLSGKLIDVVHEIEDMISVATHVTTIIYLDMSELGTGHDDCRAAIEESVFKVLWIPLHRLYRLVHYEEELKIKKVIAFCGADPIRHLELDSVIDPSIHDVCLSATVLLKEIPRMSNPTYKLEKLVQVFHFLCNQKSSGKQSKVIGADDLIPLLTYTLILNGSSDVVPECHCMQNFISESDLYGEKGYCLTSMQTVLAYMLTLDHSEMSTTPESEPSKSNDR